MSEHDDKVLKFPRAERHELDDVIDNLRRRVSGRSLGYCKLVGRIPVPVKSASLWAMKFAERTLTHRKTGTDPWCVAKTIIRQVKITTVFTGLDHNSIGNADQPLVFETRMFGSTLSKFQNRCATWEQAEAMHSDTVRLIRTGHPKLVT